MAIAGLIVIILAAIIGPYVPHVLTTRRQDADFWREKRKIEIEQERPPFNKTRSKRR